MDTITVLPNDPGSTESFIAIAGDKQATGGSVGQVIDELRAKLDGPEEATLVIVQPMTPDRFFTAEQHARLGELMTKWRTTREGGGTISANERIELNALIITELKASAARAEALLRSANATTARLACHAIIDQLPDESLRDAIESLTSDYEMHLSRALQPNAPPVPPPPVKARIVGTEVAPVNPITEID